MAWLGPMLRLNVIAGQCNLPHFCCHEGLPGGEEGSGGGGLAPALPRPQPDREPLVAVEGSGGCHVAPDGP